MEITHKRLYAYSYRIVRLFRPTENRTEEKNIIEREVDGCNPEFIRYRGAAATAVKREREEGGEKSSLKMAARGVRKARSSPKKSAILC